MGAVGCLSASARVGKPSTAPVLPPSVVGKNGLQVDPRAMDLQHKKCVAVG